MKEINIPKQKLFEVVDQIMKRKDFKYARIYAMYHPRHGIRIKYFGAKYNKDALPFIEGVMYLDITYCFESGIKTLIISNIIEEISSWLLHKQIIVK